MSDNNWLRKYFRRNPGRLINKWDHYFDIYDRHLSRYRGKAPVVLEIGVYHGGSLQMWKKYFGRGATIYGIDVDERTRDFGEDGIHIVIGDQSDREFLRELVTRIGPIDIVIDDGGHTMEQQIVSFEELWPAVVDGGEYIVEDLHTSYWGHYGGGLGRSGTFIEWAKDLIDRQHAWHMSDPELARDGKLEPDEYTRSIRGMHIYDSVIVFDRARVERPWTMRTGSPSFPLDT